MAADPLRRATEGLLVGTLVAAALGAGLAPAHAVDPVDGPLTSGDPLFPHQGNGGYDVSHYDVDIAWTPGLPAATIEATTTIDAATTGPPLSSFGLDLEGLTVDSVKVNDVAATFSRINEGSTEPPGKKKLVVTPVTPVDGDFTVEVDYHGVPTSHIDGDGSSEGWVSTLDGATFVNQPIGSMTGFPNNNTPADKATYTFAVDVPSTLEAVSNGELVSSATAAGRRTWVWNETQPMASELALISIGEYTVLQSTVSLSDGRTIPEWSFIDSTVYALNQASIDAQRGQLSTILQGLEGLFGPYPGLSTGIVVDPVTVGYALETQDRPFFPSSSSVTSSLVHELAHQWYGDAVSPTEWNDLWINEGMATWAPVHESGASTYDEFHGDWASTPDDSPNWDIPPAGMTDTADLFGWQSYQRGAMTYEALRTLLGETRFHTFIFEWQHRNGGGSHGAADFIALAEEIAGQSLTAFFDDWIYDADKPAWPTPLPPPPPPPPPTAVPVGAGCGVQIKGKARVGRQLRARVAGCPAGAAYGYQWYAGDKPIAKAHGATYRIKASKLGKRIRLEVTVSAAGYQTAQRSSPPTRKVRQ